MPEDKKNNGGAKQQKAGTKIDKKAHYLSRKESRDIVKANKKAMKELQQKQLRHVTEDKYTTQMKDEGNLVEFENLHICGDWVQTNLPCTIESAAKSANDIKL